MKRSLFTLLLFLSLSLLLTVGISAETGTGDGEKNTFLLILAAVLIGLVVAGVSLFIMYRSMSTVRKQKRADDYVDEGSFALSECRDVFLYSRVTRVRINTNNKKR